MSLIDDIVAMEWEELMQIKRTDENKKTFDIMRKSQFELWSDDLIQSYYSDLLKAHERGWNLTTEKYARILEYTDYLAYTKIEYILPQVGEDSRDVIDYLLKIQGDWMKQFEKRYPRLALAARGINAYEDQEQTLKYEESLKSELLTYSSNTLMLYAKMIIEYKKANKNYILEMMKITCRYYNYTMIEEAERNLSN